MTIYATGENWDQLWVIDAATLRLVDVIEGILAPVPTAVEVSPDGDEVFISSPNGVSVIDTAAARTAGFIPEAGVLGMVVSGDGDQLFLAVRRTKSPEEQFTSLKVADTQTMSVTDSIDGPVVPAFFLDPALNEPWGIEASPDDSLMYVAFPSLVVAYDLHAGTMSVLDSGTGWPGYRNYDLAIHPTGRYVYAISTQGLRVVDTAVGDAELIEVPAGYGPEVGAVVVHPSGQRAYVAQGLLSLFEFALDHAPTVSGLPTPAVAGQPYEFALDTTGEPAPTVSLTRGTLPDGLTLSPDGTLTGTPTTAGTYRFSVTASNDVGADAELDLTITVRSLSAPQPVPATGSLGS